MATFRLPPAERPSSAMKILGAGLRHDFVWIGFAVVATLAAATALAMHVKPLYRAQSTLLVLLGSEYTYRSAPGEAPSNAGALNRDQILRTEIEILQEDDLHRDVVLAIGADTLYPSLAKPAGDTFEASSLFAQAVAQVRTLVDGPQAAVPKVVDPVAKAVMRLDANLSFQAIKDGNGIEMTFSHEDPVLASRVLQLLEDDYLKRRRELFFSHDRKILDQEVDTIKQKLADADQRILEAKQSVGVDDYVARRAILQNEQGALETDLRLARNQADQNTARISQLDQQVSGLSPVYQTLSNPLMLQLTEQRHKAAVDLQASKTQATRDAAHLADVGVALQQINVSEHTIERLTRDRDVLVEAYKAADKVRSEKALAEDVESLGRDNVRVLQSPRPPAMPTSIRSLILLSGAVVACLVAALVSLLLHSCRRVYLLPEALEQETGLRVILSVPNSKLLARRTFRVDPFEGCDWGGR